MARNHPSTDRWRAEVGRKIGHVLDFTPTRVGQTLHVPCARGHKVDVEINKPMPPEAVTRKMLHDGWTIGNRLLCPEHARKKAEPAKLAVVQPQEQRKPRAGPRHNDLRDRIMEAVAQLGPVAVQDLAELLSANVESVRTSIERLRDLGKVVRKAGDGGRYLYSLAPKKPEQPEEPKPMSASVTPIQPQPSDEAKAARRLAHMLLEEQFDVEKGCFRNGYSDAKIAAESGAAVAFVSKRREEEFGPLKQPPEIAAAREELDAFEQKIAEIERSARAAVESLRSELGLHRGRLSELVKRNGW
jgi:hypothetical protein